LAGALQYIRAKGKYDMEEKLNPVDFVGFTPEEWQSAYESSRCPKCGNTIIEELLSPALLSYSCYSCKKRVYLKLRQMEGMLH
jgi:DNA-directed RNA polymerase subunit RPC12/RpoP